VNLNHLHILLAFSFSFVSLLLLNLIFFSPDMTATAYLSSFTVTEKATELNASLWQLDVLGD